MDRNKIKKFLHSGGLGDIIYSIPVIKTILQDGEKAILYIKRYNHYNNIVDNYESIYPLLKEFNFIKEVLPVSSERSVCDWDEKLLKDSYDLDKFRNSLNVFENHIIKCHFAGQNIMPSADWNKPWLKEYSNISDNNLESFILINRTERYHDKNSREKWLKLFQSNSQDIKIFIGLEHEYNLFKIFIGLEHEYNLWYIKTKDLLQVFKLINKAKEVWCNQSVVLTLAQSVGKKIKLELEPKHKQTVCLGVEEIL